MEATLTRMPVETRETARHETLALIASDKVDGTAVYRSNGEKIGRIENVMINKRSGQVAYAVMTFGGVLGLGEQHFPLPWSLLTYSEDLGGYEVNVSDRTLEKAPRYDTGASWNWDDPENTQKVQKHYNLIFI